MALSWSQLDWPKGQMHLMKLQLKTLISNLSNSIGAFLKLKVQQNWAIMCIGICALCSVHNNPPVKTEGLSINTPFPRERHYCNPSRENWMFNGAQGFSTLYDSAPPPPPPSLASRLSLFLSLPSVRAYWRDMGGRGGGRSLSYDDEKAWFSRNYSMPPEFVLWAQQRWDDSRAGYANYF